MRRVPRVYGVFTQHVLSRERPPERLSLLRPGAFLHRLLALSRQHAFGGMPPLRRKRGVYRVSLCHAESGAIQLQLLFRLRRVVRQRLPHSQ